MNDQAHCWESLLTDDERLVAEGYARPQRRPSGPMAVLAIDLYQRVFGDRREPLEQAIERFPSSCGTAAWDALPAITAVLEASRAAGLPVVHTTTDTRGGATGGLGSTLRQRRAATDAAAVDFHPAVRPVEGELVVRKGRASAFFGTALIAWLVQRGVRSLVVVGESTSGCVRASVVDAYSYGFEVVVVEEGVFDRSPLSHKASLFDMHLKYATVWHVDDVVQLLGSAAAVPAG